MVHRHHSRRLESWRIIHRYLDRSWGSPGNSLVLLFSWCEAACTYGGGVALDGVDHGTGKLGAQRLVVGAGEVGAQVLAGLTRGEVGAEQVLDGGRAVLG